MRNSNSRGNSTSKISDKPQQTTTYSQNRLMKTQLPPKSNAKQALNSTEYKLPPTNTPSMRKIESSKSTNSSNKQIPRQQVNFDIEKHMTESKIITAKESLQLLKKKMNRTGMSRQKTSTPIQSNQNIQSMQKTSYAPDSMKKIKPDSTKNLQNYEPVSSKYQQQQSYNNRNNYEPASYKAQPKKGMQQQKIQKVAMKKTTSITQNYVNQAEQIPIVRKQTFEEMLERQLRKQQAMKNPSSNNNNHSAKNQQQKFQLEQYAEEGQIFQCRKGCGRQFNANVIAKHQKVCQKVFQSKRKVFNTAAQRQVQNEGGFQKAPQPMNNYNQTKKPVQKKGKIPKWKLQSAQLRAGLKAVNNIPLTKQEEALTNMQKDSMVPCNYCGRKFSQQAAKRHIPFCQNKAKQTGRPSNPKKR